MALKPECDKLASRLFEIRSFAEAFLRQLAGRPAYLPGIKLARESLETTRSLVFLGTADRIFSDRERDSVVSLVGQAKSALAREEWSEADNIGHELTARLLVLALNKVCECQCGER